MEDAMVSVCVPIYNASNTIEQTMDSIINQSYSNLEIIVVDNCSTDNTYQLLQNFHDNRIRKYRNNTNIGMVGNWNKCLEYVNGSYIHFVCADDVLEPDCIEKKINMAMKYDDVAMVFSASTIINEENVSILSRHQFNKDCIVNGKKLAKKSLHTKNLYGEPSNVLFRSSIIPQIGHFATNTCYATDWDMWLRVSCQGNVGYINEELMKYRMSVGNETSRISFSKMLADDKVMLNNLTRYRCMKVTILDKVIHRMMYIFRMVARRIFMLSKSK